MCVWGGGGGGGGGRCGRLNRLTVPLSSDAAPKAKTIQEEKKKRRER